MSLGKIIENKFHGLPGIGVNGSNGQKGSRGVSTYVGYLKSFFDGIYFTDEQYGYIRIKNEKLTDDTTLYDYYYRKDGNFYRKISGVDDTLEEMLKFTIYPFKGVYYDRTPNNDSSAKTWKAIEMFDVTSSRIDEAFLNRKTIGNVLGFKYPLKDSKTIPEIAFDVKVSNDYIESRGNILNASYNYSNGLTGDVFVPTNLKDIYNVGDILFIQDDVSGEVLNFIVITENLVGCTFEKFLNQEFVSIDSMSSTFYENGDRAYLQKKFSVPVVNVPDTSVFETINKDGIFQKNFINKSSHDSVLNIERNKIRDINDFVRFQPDSSSYESKIIEEVEVRTYDPAVLNISGNAVRNWFNFTTETGSNIRLSNLFLKSIDKTNIDIPEYNNSRFVFSDKIHIPSIGVENFVVDNTTIKFSIDGDYYFSDADSNYDRFGIEIYQYSEDLPEGEDTSKGQYERISRVEANAEDTLEYNLGIEQVSQGDNQTIGILTFVYTEDSTKYISSISEITYSTTYDDSSNLIFGNNTFKTNESTYIVGDDFANSSFDFSMAGISAEGTSDASLNITTIDDNIKEIKDVYLNNVQVVKDGVAIGARKISSWLSLNPTTSISLSDDKKTLFITKINITSNFPTLHYTNRNEDGVEFDDTKQPTSYKEYFTILEENSSGLYPIGSSNLKETKDREMFITVVSKKLDGQLSRTTYPISQSGIQNSLKDIEVVFENDIKNNKIDEMNSNDNGILCNQLQLFTKMSLSGFDDTGWNLYFDNPEVTITVQIDRTSEANNNSYYYTKDTNMNNVQVYSNNSISDSDNNAVKGVFSWYCGAVSNFSSLSVGELSNLFNEFESYGINASTSESTNNKLESFEGWIPLREEEFKRNASSNIPHGINFVLQDANVSGLSISNPEAYLRSFFEIANPIPMEFNIQWKVTNIKITGKLREEFDEDCTVFTFNKSLANSTIYSEDFYLSDNIKFVVNPISLVLCPENIETQSEISGSIKRVGSEEQPLYSLKLEQLDSSLLTEYEDKEWSNFFKRQSFISSLDGIPDITYYKPKKKYFQDDVMNFTIKAKEIVYDDVSVSAFSRMNTALNTKSGEYQSNYNIIGITPLDSDSKLDSYKTCYIRSMYDADCMNPEKREGVLTFYYNNKLYNYSLYNQWNKISPLLSNNDLSVELVDASLQNAKQIWNYEYEVSSDYQANSIFGGVLTKSGDGYLSLKEKYDENQYESDGIYSLSETKELAEEYVFDGTLAGIVTPPADFTYQPEDGKFFRSFLKTMDWIFPNFYSTNGSYKIYPYYLTNTFISDIDSSIMMNFINGVTSSKDFTEYILTKAENISENVPFDVDAYEDRKLEFTVGSSDSASGDIKESSLEKINMLIPYNKLFEIYPRIMYNTDMGTNVVNTFMLKQPSVIKEGNYKFNKWYFDNTDASIDLLPPWNFNK